MRKQELYKIASERIRILFEEAKRTLVASPVCSRRYIRMMENIAKRMDMTLEKDVKRSYCKKCKTIYGSKSVVRAKKGLVEITCANCGDVRRLPYHN